MTLDVQVPGTYHISVGKEDGDYTLPIHFRECDISCFDGPGDTPAFQSQSFGGQLCLDRSRYLFQFTDDLDFSEYELFVTLVDTTCD